MNGEASENPLISLCEGDGILLAAHVRVQCMEPIDENGTELCGEVIDGELQVTEHNPDEAPEMVVRCPACSARTGSEVLIPVLFLCGYSVEDTFNPSENDDEEAEEMEPTETPEDHAV